MTQEFTTLLYIKENEYSNEKITQFSLKIY